MKKRTIGIGIGIVAVVGILVIGFTNIDTIISVNISETLSEVEISNPLASLDYKINTRCRLYETLALEFTLDDYNTDEELRKQQLLRHDKTEREKELERERLLQIQQKYNDRLYDYAKEHDLQWYDESGRAPAPADMAFGQKNYVREFLETLDANPKFVKEFLPLETWPQQPYVLTVADRIEDPQCVNRIEKTYFLTNSDLNNLIPSSYSISSNRFSLRH